MAVTLNTDMFTPQILIDAIRGKFKGKNAFMGSILVSSGGVMVRGTMPRGGQGAVGKTIDVPYFGTLPAFVNNPDGSAVTPQKLAQTSEQATVGRSSLAVETSAWAQGVAEVDPALGDPYQEGADQAMIQAEREMDRIIVAEAATTSLVRDVYSSTSANAVTLDHRQVARARTLWGDEQDNIVAMITHSQCEADLVEETDADGKPLYVAPMGTEAQGAIRRFAGVPLLVSDQVPLTGSTMGSVTATGTSPPTITLSGEPLGPWELKIECVVGGAPGTATYRFSVDNGNTWSATLTTPAGGGNVLLTDTAVDSLVGKNGATGVTANFGNATYDADNAWTAKANLKVTSFIVQAGAMAFWYNQQRLGSKTDVDILADTDILAMHLYYAAKLYRRRRMGTRPGVIAIKTNARNFVG